MDRASRLPSKWAMLAAALPLVLLSCGKPSAPAVPAPSAAAAPSAPAAAAAPAQAVPVPSTPAEVIFTNGDVQGQVQGGAWSPLDIGAKLNRGDSVKVGAASECQLKLADLAVVDIQENTQVSVDALTLSGGSSRAKLGLQAGTVLSKVKKLGGSDSYVVRTNTAVGGVRGTEFGVTVTPQGNTLVTVKDGAVAVLPAAYDPDAVRELSSTPNADLEQIAQSIESSATPVQAGQQLTMTPQQAQQAETDFKPIQVATAEIVQQQAQASVQASAQAAPAAPGTTPPPAPTPTPPAAVIEARNKAIQAATATLATVVSKPVRLTPVNTRKLKALDTLPPPSAPAPAATSSAPASPTPAAQPVTISVSATPADSQIELNGKAVGTGSYSASVNPGQSVTLVIHHEGYATKTIALTAKESASYPVRLDPQPIEASFAAGTSALIRSVEVSGDVVIAADRQGTLIGTDRRGRALWKVSTQNAPNENSSPVISGQTLYFTGGKEFIVASARTGAVTARTSLDSATTHLFGQRVAVSGGVGAYPTSTALTIFNTSTGETIRQVAIPGGTLMTPTITEDGRVLVVSQTGILFVIDPQAGQVLSQVPTGASQPVATSVLVSGTRAWFADRKGLLVCVDLDAHKVIWKATLKGTGSMGVFQNLEKSPDGIFAFANNTIFAFSAADGTELFPPISGASTPALDRDGKLYFGTQSGTLAIVDDKTGKTLKSLTVKGAVNTRPYADGPRVLLGTAAGQVIVVYPDSIP